MPKLPKVLIFTPTYEAKDYCFDAFIKNCELINYPNKQHIIITNDKTSDYANKLRARLRGKPFSVIWVGRGATSREAITRAQAHARTVMLNSDYDYLFSLESDIFPPPDCIQRLIMHSKDVVTGLYMIGTPDKKWQTPCATFLEWKEDIRMHGTKLLVTPQEIEEFCTPGLKPVQAGGMGVCMMSRYIVEKVPFIFEPDMGGHSDIFWFNDVFRLGIQTWVDTSVRCAHEYSDWRKVADK